MTIQIPNPGTGVPADQTGDSPWLAMKKVADNFSNTSHAASRLVGVGSGQIPTAQQTLQAVFNTIATSTYNDPDTDCNNFEVGSYNFVGNTNTNAPPMSFANILTIKGFSTNKIQIALGYNNDGFMWRNFYSGAWRSWVHTRNNVNTIVDSNGFIKAASPIVQVHADKIELNDDAKQQDITFTKNGIGDYTISGTSGLSTDGWYLELPLDLNGNPKVAVTLTETDGIIELKCYKRTFNMTTFIFEPDLDEPMDVPEGRWIDIRLNEIEHEAPTMPDVDLDKED